MDILAARNISVVPVTSPMAPVSTPARAAMPSNHPVPRNKSSPDLEQEHDPDMDFAPMFCEVIVGQSDSQSAPAEQMLASQRMMLNSPPRTIDKCYKCDLCPRSYSSRAGLWYHKKAHSGDKQYSCPVCYKRFSQKSHLEVHLNFHRNKGHASPSDGSAELPPEADAPLSLVTGSRSDEDDEADLDAAAAEAPVNDAGDHDRPGGAMEEGANTQDNDAELRDGASRASPARPEQHNDQSSRTDEARALSQMEFARMFCEPVYQEGGTAVSTGSEAGDAAEQAIRHGSARFNDLIISAIPAAAAEPRALQPAQVHALLNKSPKLDKCYRCELCSNTYSSRAGLWYHRKTHAGSKQYTCRICRQSFTQKGHLQSHMRTHLGDRPYPCGQCEATFTDALSLENHLLTHSSEKPFACRHCNESFPRQLQLIQHERMHVVNKPLKCPHCDRSFALKNNLVNHLRVHRSS